MKNNLFLFTMGILFSRFLTFLSYGALFLICFTAVIHFWLAPFTAVEPVDYSKITLDNCEVISYINKDNNIYKVKCN